MGATSADIHYSGTQTLHILPNDHKIYFQYPKLYMCGFVSGNFHAYWDNYLYLWSRKTKFFAQVKFAIDKGGYFSKAKEPLDKMVGGCYKVSDKFL